MFLTVYDFLYNWLFGNGLGALTTQGAETVTILFSILLIVIAVCVIISPIIWIFKIIFGR